MWNKFSEKKEEERGDKEGQERKGKTERKGEKEREKEGYIQREKEMGVPFLSSLCEYPENFRLKY